MPNFSDNMHFRHSWRPYQERVLQRAQQHLRDGRLHIVAPPGSGKTVLGLELARLIGKPMLVLCPTLAVREQWGERLVQDFLAGEQPEWLSFNLSAPGKVTISTYQALHSAVRKGEGLLKNLLAQGVRTLVADECHHLQKAWWGSLIQLTKTLEPQLVALTATPPYDVSAFEWQRYTELCGPIDEEISVPELIAAQNLCPHQDYIWFTLPEEAERSTLQAFRRQIDDFLEMLPHRFELREAVKQHPWLREPEAHLEAIYENPAYFSALLIVLEGIGGVAPATAIGIIGADDSVIPGMTMEWLEYFLNEALFRDDYFQALQQEEWMQQLERQLRRAGAIEQKRAYLLEPPRLSRTVRNSLSKLDAIEAIVRLEYEAMRDQLRMAILTDNIRPEALPKSKLEPPPIKKIGAIPIFELLRRTFPIELELGVLTGSLVILPRTAKAGLAALLEQSGLPGNAIRMRPLPHDENYFLVEAHGTVDSLLTGLVTALFSRGELSVLIGTTALLGEGWDAPSINTLVLATVVGSFVLSNQIRGRAIRIQPGQADKTANIWHLACIDNYHPQGGQDWLNLRRRFRSFTGPSFEPNPTVENGVGRFHLPDFPYEPVLAGQLNDRMAVYARNRQRLKREWHVAISNGVQMAEEITLPVAHSPRYQRTVRAFQTGAARLGRQQLSGFFRFYGLLPFLAVALSGLTIFFFQALPLGMILASGGAIGAVLALLGWIRLGSPLSLLEMARQLDGNGRFRRQWIGYSFLILLIALGFGIGPGVGAVLLYLCSAGLLFCFWYALGGNTRAFQTWRYSGSLANSGRFLEAAGRAILKSMEHLNLLASPPRQVQVKMIEEENGLPGCYLSGASLLEERLFLQALEEFFNPVDNPRYLLAIEYEPDEGQRFIQFYAVPSVFGQRRSDAEIFLEQWEKQPAQHRLHYTRTFEGRRLLLRARAQSLGGPAAERRSTWR